LLNRGYESDAALPSNGIIVDSTEERWRISRLNMSRYARVQEESIYNLIPKECEEKAKSIRFERILFRYV